MMRRGDLSHMDDLLANVLSVGTGHVSRLYLSLCNPKLCSLIAVCLALPFCEAPTVHT